MDARWQAAFYGVGFLVFVVAAFHPQAGTGRLHIEALRWVAAGLALVTVPVMWGAIIAGW